MNGSLQSISNGALFELKRTFTPRRVEIEPGDHELAGAWRQTFDFCVKSGMKVQLGESGIDAVQRFIRELRERKT